ncbi:MAG TPA: hypothetical protein VF736_11775 [Pyrinomonadaceae bacterium]|jgi:hypothetical protein
MTTSFRRLASRTALGLLGAAMILSAPFLGGHASAAYADTPTRDQSVFWCPYEHQYVSFDWGQPMPYGGWLGRTGYYRAKDVQAYDAQDTGDGFNWGFQAQDGSFVCRMDVTGDRNRITFLNCRPFANWSLTYCFAVS